MSKTAIRLLVVVGIIFLTYGVSKLMQVQLKPPEVEVPSWTFRDMPMQLDRWRGEDTQLDPQIAAATGADVIVDRIYRNDVGAVVSMHTAMFKDPAEGVQHSPTTCYRSNGWNLMKETRENIKISDNLTIPVYFTTWEKSGETVYVIHWYQIGENVVYDRLGLGSLRWKMPGKEKWPVNIKVMLQISVSDPEETKAAILNIAEKIAAWLNQPEHQKYLGQWPAV